MMSLTYLVMPEARKYSMNEEDMEKDRNHLECNPTGQNGDNLNLKINKILTDYNALSKTIKHKSMLL